MCEAICFLHEIDSHHAVGGKARGLTKLIAAGFSVPDGFVAMPDATDGELVNAYRRLGAGPVAVRSSAEEEDAECRSYAGQFDTFLDVSGEAQVIEAVTACRASASSPSVASYRQDATGLSRRISVIIQRMVHPDYAGVAFAEMDGTTVVEGVAGLGDRLVSGRVGPSPLPEPVHARVQRAAREVVQRLGGAQDLEWAVAGAQVWMLQARPVTAPLPATLPDQFRLWTAANVQEAIPRPLTPLSEQVTLANLSRVFQTAYEVAGLPAPDGPSVRFVKGRVYMSYSAMASAISATPGFRMESLLLSFGDSPTLAPFISYRRGPRLPVLLRLPVTLARVVSWMLFADRHIQTAVDVAGQFAERVRSTLASDPTDAQLLELFRSGEISGRLPFEAMSTTTALANRFLTMLMETAAVSAEHALADAMALALAGDLESLEPVRRLSALASWLRANPGRPDQDPEVQARLADFMEVCGFRCEEEAELAHPRWVEQPREVLRLARQLASAPANRPAEVPRPTAAAPSWRRILLQPRLSFMAAQARIWQRRREQTRALLTRVGMSVRVLLLAIGRRLCDRTILHAPEDVFYLLQEEIMSLSDRSLLSEAAIAARVDRRRAHHQRMRAWPPPPRLLAELSDGRLVPFVTDPGGGALRGFGASAGRVTGRARVVRDVGEAGMLEPGEILVTRTTDIGWTPLFHIVSAVVTEIGAPTSHAAIVARELGVPAVVNVDRVTELLRTGDLLFVDGWAGLVRHLGDQPSSGRPAPELSGRSRQR